ncbi:dTDP-4-amino-4,6-dideoxy-D-glucose transaminase [subsurface metagenome]
MVFQGPEKITGLGINCKMNEFQAAMGLCVLDDFNTILSQRENVYDYYQTNLQENIHLEFQKQNEFSSNNYSYFPVIFRNEQKLIKVQKMLMKENIFPRRYFFPSLESLDIVESVQNVPNSSNISKRILCLPLYEGLNRKVQDRIINVTNKNS